MDKVIDTPRTSQDALKAQFELVRKSYEDKIARLERELAASRRETDTLTGAVLDLREKLAEQKEQMRVLEDEMLALNTMRHEALKDAVENMEIANEFKGLMEQYRQREAEANKALRVAYDVLEKILEETREKK